MKDCYMSIRMARMKKIDNTKCWWKCGTIGYHILYDPIILLLDIYSKVIHSYVQQKACTSMYIAAIIWNS